jgi:quinoprotein glucose dehydrogenase
MNQKIPGWVVRALLVGAVFGVAGVAGAQEVARLDPPPATDPVAWDAANKDASKFRVARGLTSEVWAAEPMLANPVQMTTDEKGRFWVAETYRFRLGGVIDVRNIDWLDDDLAMQTVEDRVNVVKKHMGKRVESMTWNSERLQRIEDTDGDGRADAFSTFAAGFNTIADGIASGVLVRGEDVYFANIPNFWLLKQKDGKEVSRTALHTGYGVHYNLEGHDLHGVKMGPDGRVYFSIGDRGINVKTMEGRTLKQIDCGTVLRCQPDGTELEIFATGLRNPQDLLFDEYGNMFTGDNNCDYGDKARWVYVVQGGETGWRIGYQHIHHPAGAGPWMLENLWRTEAEGGDAAYRLPPITNISSGPSGVTYQPTGATGERYRGKFFLCDFRGGRVNSGVWSFGLKPKGASFELTDPSQLIWGVLATDIETGNDGALYVSDWVDGWAKPNKGRIHRIFDEKHIDDPGVVRTKQLIESDWGQKPVEELTALLGYADPRVRQAAQFELVKRGGPAHAMLYGTAQNGGTRFARVHAIWGIWQLGQKDVKAVLPLVGLLSDADEEIRAQAARVLGDCWCTEAGPKLVELLQDDSVRVRFFAATALGRVGGPGAVQALVAMLAQNENQDAYLRHAGVMGLMGSATVADLQELGKDARPAVRMGAVLAMRRLERPEIAQFLKDADSKIVAEAARAINDVPIQGAMPALAGLITEKGLADLVWYRVLNANFRLGTPETARALAQFVGRSDAPEKMRVEALRFLEQWAKPSQKDYVVGIWRPLAERDGSIAKGALAEVLAGVLKGSPDPVRIAAIRAARGFGLADESTMFAIVSDATASPDVRSAALDALASLNGPRTAEAVNMGLDQGKGVFRQTAIRLLAKLPDAVTRLNQTLQTGSVSDQQMVLRTLANVDGPAVEQIQSQWMDRLLGGKVAPELQLDLLETAQESKSDAVKAKAKKYTDAKPKDDLMAEYRESLAGGNVDAGRRIFNERQDVSCIRCHQAGGAGGTVGPDLAGLASTKDRAYLMESILLPNKQIAPGFDAVTIKTKDGKSVGGILKSETDAEIAVDVVDKGIVKVAKANVAGRSPGQSPMPEGLGKALSKQDMRNLVEFLASLKQPGEAGGAVAAAKTEVQQPAGGGHPAAGGGHPAGDNK